MKSAIVYLHASIKHLLSSIDNNSNQKDSIMLSLCFIMLHYASLCFFFFCVVRIDAAHLVWSTAGVKAMMLSPLPLRRETERLGNGSLVSPLNRDEMSDACNGPAAMTRKYVFHSSYPPPTIITIIATRFNCQMNRLPCPRRYANVDYRPWWIIC